MLLPYTIRLDPAQVAELRGYSRELSVREKRLISWCDLVRSQMEVLLRSARLPRPTAPFSEETHDEEL